MVRRVDSDRIESKSLDHLAGSIDEGTAHGGVGVIEVRQASQPAALPRGSVVLGEVDGTGRAVIGAGLDKRRGTDDKTDRWTDRGMDGRKNDTGCLSGALNTCKMALPMRHVP